MNRCWDWCQ